jgi:Bacterial PH domain
MTLDSVLAAIVGVAIILVAMVAAYVWRENIRARTGDYATPPLGPNFWILIPLLLSYNLFGPLFRDSTIGLSGLPTTLATVFFVLLMGTVFLPGLKIVVVNDHGVSIRRVFRKPRHLRWEKIADIGTTEFNRAWVVLKSGRIIWLNQLQPKDEFFEHAARHMGQPVIRRKKPEWAIRLREHGML